MFRHRRIENIDHFPQLGDALVRQTELLIREDGPDAWGARINLPDHCWYCWEKGDTWFYVPSQSHIWITQKQDNDVFVLFRDDCNTLCCERYTVRDIDDPA